jgi:hypothetical protein
MRGVGLTGIRPYLVKQIDNSLHKIEAEADADSIPAAGAWSVRQRTASAGGRRTCQRKILTDNKDGSTCQSPVICAAVDGLCWWYSCQ